MKNLKFFFICNLCIFAMVRLKNAKLQYPPPENIAPFKSISLFPIGSVCGLEYRDTLCDNRYTDPYSCSNSSLIFYCDQTCPYGNTLQNLNSLDQLKLDIMNPCVIFKDFGYLINKNSESKNSYYFDKTNNLCSLNNKISQWKPFNFELSKSKPEFKFSNSRTSDSQVVDSGFSVSLWFTQSGSNNGTLMSIIQDDNSTIFTMTVQTISKKIYITHICYKKASLYPNKDVKENCFMEFELKSLKLKDNFIALRINKKSMDIFCNEPNDFNENLGFSSIDLNYDLGSYFKNNSKKLNFLVGTDLEANTKFFGWIQDFQVFSISLVNYEIASLYGSLRKKLKIQPECRCPNDYPRNSNENSTYCLKNKFSRIDLLDTKSRVNEYSHPISYINDDDFKTSWISCILTITNPIEIVLDLENGIYLIQRIEIFFSNLPPTNLVIERFFNNNWILVQKYSIECSSLESNCVQLPSDFDNGFFGGYTIVWSNLIENEDKFFSNASQVENIKASKIRLILSGYYPSIKNDIRKLYYAISELRVKGRCDCNGYSSNCDMSQIPFKCSCDPESMTEGGMCEKCRPLYNNVKYETRYTNPLSVCEKCNCNSRSEVCQYDSNLNKGLCQNCANNSTGSNCERCLPNYFFNQTSNQCEKCVCNSNGVVSLQEKIISNYCDQTTGRCICKQNVEGEKCDKCKQGFYDFSNSNIQGCRRCECNTDATILVSGTNLTLCDEITGQCKCISQYVSGIKCDRCVESMYDLENGCTKQCSCDPLGSVAASCDQFTGQCICKSRVRGLKCNQCDVSYYNLTSTGCSNKCECNIVGTYNPNLCDSISGNCLCRPGYAGKNCDRCMSGYWRSNSQCIKCQCNLNGILDPSNICEEATGKCICNELSEGFSCDTCKPGFYGLSNTNETCKKCECDPIGTSKNSLRNGNYVCDSKTSQCVCNKNRIGIKCESCAVGFFFLNLNGIDCLECACDPYGSIPGSNCDSLTGECVCKVANGIGGTRCDQCSEGYFNFSKATGSCSTCGCNIAGSYDQNCDLNSGQCNCKEFVTGLKCNVCITGTSNLDINNPYGCSKSPSKQSPPFLTVKNANTITVSWLPPDYPNGIIRYYLLFRNETLIAKVTDKSFEDTKLEPFTIYSYRIESYNDEGSTSSRLQYITIGLPSQPCCKFTYRLSNIRSTQADILWTQPERLNGMNPLYLIRVYYKLDPNKPINSFTLDNLNEQINSSLIIQHNNLSMSNNLQARITNLNPYTFYLANIKACNRDLNDPNRLYCLDGIPESSTKNLPNLNNYTSFITSQDKPENQTEPILISINSTFVIAGVKRPNMPNGIIVMYEIWKKMYNSSNQQATLACAIEDLFDPNNQIQSADNRFKICVIKNLSPKSTYGLIATSSTIIGRSNPSRELIFTTIENPPVCPPTIQESFSYSSSSIYIKWVPSYFQTINDTYWMKCLGGGINNYSLYLLNEKEKFLIYSGLENSFNYTKLNSSQNYYFYLELCNIAGCLRTSDFMVRTLDPPPNKWNLDDLKYTLINSSALKFDWSNYVPYNTSNSSQVKFRLERSKIAFSKPPTLLESGYRFHGFNYFKFDSEKYYPQGYPYFGLKYNIKTKRDGLVYFAASSYSQSEISATQLFQNRNWFLSNTQYQTEQCSIYLEGSKNNNDWNSIKLFRLNSFAFMYSNDNFTQVNSSQCRNQVITDVTGVFVGGLPDDFFSRDETSFSRQEFKKINRNRLYGCIKNMSTIIQFDTIKSNLNSTIPLAQEKDFDFREAEASIGEPYNSNTIYGCPLNLDTESNPVHLLGYGYLYSNIRDTMPTQNQTNQIFSLNMQFRTEWPTGIIYFNFDIDNEQYLLVRLLDMNRIQVCLKTRVRYDLNNQKSFLNFFDLLFNETYGINSISNGYWSNLNLEIDFSNRSILIQLNQTRIVFKNFVTNSNFPENFNPRILNASLLFTFYFNSQSFMGGFDLNMLPDIYSSLNQVFISAITRRFFFGIFEFLESLEESLYFTGCFKEIKINRFQIDFFNNKNQVAYKNVRFDGCPDISVYIEDVSPLIEIVNETIDNEILDTNFSPYTEYFYRATSFNSQGKSSSEWFLIRTPDGLPEDQVDIQKYINVKVISGYKIQVENIRNFCFYCENWSYQTKGIIKKITLTVIGSDKEQIFEFFCETICFDQSQQQIEQNGFLGNIFKKYEDPRVNRFFIDTKPITQYSLMIGICNNAGCIFSEFYNLTTLSEIPDGINPPVLINSTSSSLHLNWSIPKYPSGNITAYIIRSIDGSKENVLYFGLQTNFLFGNLRPLTNYTLVLEACNQIGCGRSPQVSYSTSEMAPLSVQTPLVLKITHNAIIIKWFKPTNDQIQFGFLKNYILFFNDKEYVYNLTSFNISICKECASNIKELINLIPGIKYEIVLSACTNGGCTNSSLLEVRTLESEPDTSDIKIEMINRTSNSIYVKWNRPSRPNGLLNKYILSVNDKIVYEGDKNEFHLQGLMPNTFYFFVVQFCNFFSCNSTEPIRFRTDEAIPEGSIVLDAQAKGSNQIELKWYSNPMDPLKPNGNIYFSVYVTGPFLLESNLGNLIELFKSNSKIIQIQTLNLLNTTVLNTKYGILDRVLANSNYDIQVNASNSKGFLLSNKISVQTLKSNPELIIPPQLTYANSTCLKIEWSEPLLLNSDDTLIYYSLIYRKKIVWNEDGPIDEPKYETEIITLFSNSLMTNFYILHHLIPFTAYSFQLTAGNSYGESKSQWSQDIYTLESSPQNQSPPQIINFTSNSVLVKFTQAQVPNGFINLFKINVFKFTNELIHLGVITLKNDTKTFNITHLEPFTYYLFTIASCNSIGCAQSSYDKFNLSNNNYIQTLPDRPQEIREPILTSPNSYSIEIKWYPPFKPNGLLQYYILERVDYINSNSSSRKYKFRSSRLNFLDDNDLESCGFYSYRIFAFNQIGFTVSNYVNITVSSSKPLIVHAPIISLINTSTARFEWTKPLTLCNITKYTLTLRNESKTLSFDLIDSKIVITHLSSFTVYRVSLSACVTLISDSCASSLVKNFRTPGFIPQGLSRPIVKLISPKVVSVEWLEPEFKNGEFLTYQVIRLNLNLNRTENLYSGQDLYFLDLSTKNLNSYRYRLIFINEFGSSISEWSDLIQIETNEPLIIDNKIRYNFNMFLECPTANFGFLKWIIQPNEILIFLKKLFNSVNSISFNSLNIIFNDLNISVSNSLEFNEKLIHLNESSFYAFELMLEIRTNSGLTYYLISERKTCNTPSKATIFGDTRIKFIRKGTYLTIDYNLNEAIVRNYNQFGLKLSKEQAIIDSKNFTQTSGELQIGPVRENEIYFLTLWACRLNFCIDFEPLVYSLSTRTPQGISNLYATLNESTSVILNWQPVLQPNGFGIRYLIYRRLACTLENPNNYIECPNDKICCGPNIYEYKPGFQCCADFFYVPVPIGQICCSNSYTTDIGYNIGEGDACCGDTPFVSNSSQKCCNLNLQNQKPNQQNQCAIFPTEILTECDEFHLISNQTQLTYLDEYLNASNTYEYNLCVENSYGQSCSSDTIKIKTNVTPPDNFTIFNFLILNERSAYFYWSEPIFPNEASIFYILLKDSIEIYKGDNLNYEDKNLLPYQTYLYTVKACNSAGCTINKNKKIVTTFPKKPTDSPNIFLVNKSHSNFTLEWKLPIYQIEKFIFIMYEIDLELEILFNFESNSTSLTKSARNINEENFFYFSSGSLLESNSTYQITITDLKANLIYSYELIACNLAGCSRSRKGQIKTNSFEIQNFNSPIPYALNESSIELIWWDPENLNGDLESFTIFRNDVAIFSTLPDKSEFYTFKDLNLQPNRVYYYKIQVSNGFFKLNTSQVNIRTPMDSKFTITKCINGNTNLKDGAINFLNILHINTTGISSNYINFSYDNSEWNNFISCLDKSLSFSIKIIVLSQEKSVQTLDFPYPNTTNSVIRFKIPGLKSNTKYLIRILINSNFPIIKSLVTDSILVKTLPTKPSGIFAEPIIQKNLYSNSISIKWKRPSGLIDMYEVQWIFSNCTSRQFENILLNLSVVNSSFFYDETNEIFVYRHKENSNFIFNSVKILGVNSYGSIESREIEFLTRGSQPKPVFDLRVSQVYSTGIKIKFKNNNFYLKYFVINLEPLNERIPNRSHEIFYPVTTECKIYNPYEIVINGLEPYTLFNLTIKAISYSGLESNVAEYLIINTLESTPKFLKPLSFEPKSTSILIKLIDPGQINGILKQFFVYHENKLIYSGTSREFLFDNLQPFTNYSIKYEVCTSMGCTRYKNELISQTLESLPEDLERPQVEVLNDCFNVKLKRPKKMNEIYRYTEIYRLSKSFGNNQFIDEILRIQTNETQFKDCDLTPNILYSYRIVVFNSIGGITSEYTESLPIILLKPFNFIKMNATQLNETLIRLDFTKPQSYSDSLVYKIFRDSNLISTIYENKSLYLEFYDSYDFLPDTFVKYNIFACNLVGCSSDDNYSIFIRTKNTPPFLVYRPILIDIGSDWVRIDASLSVVLRQSQKIVEYRFFLNDVLVNQGLESNIILENLIPNTQYKINLEVCTFFDDGCLRSKDYLYFKTLQALPVLNFEPTCQSGVKDLFIKWPLVNQEVNFYNIKHRLNNLDYLMSKLDGTKNEVLIENLIPMTRYDIFVEGCNQAGCGLSKIKTCQTLKYLPVNITIEIIQLDSSNLIKWSFENNFDNENYEFNLWRSVLLNSSLVYDSSFRPIDKSLKVVYTGSEMSFDDKDINFFTEYEYSIEINTIYGKVKSQGYRVRTRSHEPQLLILIGSIRNVYNDSVQLMIRPPLKMNGILQRIYILIKTGYIEDQREILHQKLDGLNEVELINFLDSVNLNGLLSESIYELKTRFCNQISCITSLQTIKFKTLANERIQFFDAFSLDQGSINFKWEFKKSDPWRRVRFQLRYLGGGSSLLMYEGFENSFIFQTAKSMLIYEFELLALDGQNSIIDRKSVSVKTLSEKSQEDEYPQISLQPFDNQTTIMNIKWDYFAKRTASPTRIKYELLVNNFKLYSGNLINHKQILTFDECLRLLNQTTEFNIQIKAFFNQNIYLAEPIKIPFNCSIKQLEQKLQNFNYKNIFVVFFIILIFLLTLTIFLIYCCINKYRSSKFEPSLSPSLSTLSINSSLQNMFMEKNKSFLSISHSIYNNNNTNSVISSPNPVLERSQI